MNDSGVTAAPPTRVRTMRAVAWFLLVFALVCAGAIAGIIGTDFYVRTHWPVVKGDVVRAEAKSTRVSTRDRRPTLFWVEFEVEFDPEQNGCNTGMSWTVPQRFSCIGTVRSSESSWGTPFSWIQRHPINSQARFFYNPHTGQLHFADESIFDDYPWGATVLFLLTSSVAIWLFYASQLSNALNAAVADPASPSTKDALIDLNLS